MIKSYCTDRKLTKQTFLREAKLNVSSAFWEPALLLLPKPQGCAGLGKTLNSYADSLVIPRAAPLQMHLVASTTAFSMTGPEAALITQLCL